MKQFLTNISLIPILNDFKNFSFAEFIKERYYLHFIICALISAFSDYPLMLGFFVTVFAVFREVYLSQKNKDIPFSWADIRWTYYGCVLTFLIKLVL